VYSTEANPLQCLLVNLNPTRKSTTKTKINEIGV